jgi:hypothetical protein
MTSMPNLSKEEVYATVIRKAIDCQDVAEYVLQLDDEWRKICEDILRFPEDRKERSDAFYVFIKDHPNADHIGKLVFAADLKADLSAMFPKDKYSLHWAREALEPQPPIKWIVNSLFSSGSVSLVYGEGGTKKTYSLIDCMVCVALGNKWLNFETEQSTVLLIDEESGLRRLNRRLGDIMRGHLAGKTLPFAYVSLAQFDLREQTDIEKLQELIKQSGAKLVIIDALADIMPGGDENAVKDIQPIFLGMRKTAEEEQCAIVMIHHANKGGDYRGSTALKGAVDLMLKVESKIDSPKISFKTEKVRDTEPFEFLAYAHFNGDQIWLSPFVDNKQKSLSDPQEYVIRFIAKNGASDVSTMKNKADTCSPESARKAIYFLAKEDIKYVKRIDDGGSGEKATYDLTDDGRDYAVKQGYLSQVAKDAVIPPWDL